MTEKQYPELPNHSHSLNSGNFDPLYTAYQMRAYVDADRAMRAAQAAPAAVAGPSDRIPIEDSIAWQETGTGVERNAVMVSGRTWYRDDHPLLAVATKAAPQREVFDEDGFRAWVIRNLPDNTIIGNSTWWAGHLAVWVQRFMSAAPQAAPASQDAEDAARYRYLKKYKTWDSTDVFYWLRCAPADEVDSIIDAARVAQGESNA